MKITLLLCIVVSAAVLHHAAAEIIFVAEAFRHGARAATFNRITFDRSYDVPFSSLTANGAYMHNLLGSFMRKTYIEDAHLLSPSYKEEEVEVISTRTSRTIDSAYSHLSGLYPPGTGSNITNPKIMDMLPFSFGKGSASNSTPALPFNAQTIPVYTFSDRDDVILHGYDGGACPSSENYQDASDTTTLYRIVEEKHNATFANLAEVMKVPTSSVDLKYAKKIAAELHCALYEGFNLPIDPSTELWRNLTFFYDFSNVYKMTYHQEAQHAYISHFVQDLHKVLNNAVSNESKLKLKIYSAHDYTLIVILKHFNLLSWQCKLDQFEKNPIEGPCVDTPEFASQIIWELHRINQQHYVLMKYNNEIQYICGHSENGMCPLDRFFAILQTGFLEEKEYERICGVGSQLNPITVQDKKKKKNLRAFDSIVNQLL